MKRNFVFIFLLALFTHVSEAILIKGKIEVVKGRVYVYRNGRTLQAIDDMNIYTGDLIETAQNSAIMVQLMDIGLLKLKPETQIQFPMDDDEQIQVSRLKLTFGEMWLKVRKMELGEVFEVKTPNAVELASGVIFATAYDKRKKKTVSSVIEGDLEVHKDRNHFFLMAGEQLILDNRKGSKPRQRRIDMHQTNQEWKQVITIREKLERRMKETVRMPDENGEIKDFERPLVHIVEPLEGIPYKNKTMVVKGNIHEDNLERISLTVNGKVIKDVPTALKNITEEVVLKPGENVIELKAIDKYGNVGVDVKKIKLSDMPPSIGIFYPFDNQELSDRFVDLQGVVDDPDIDEVTVFLNDRRIATERCTPTFRVPLVLDIGQNILRVEATNGVGLTGITEIIVHTDTKTQIVIPLGQMFGL